MHDEKGTENFFLIMSMVVSLEAVLSISLPKKVCQRKEFGKIKVVQLFSISFLSLHQESET